MVKVSMVYEGNLRVRAKHEPSGAEIVTDAPTDNHGKGEGFSPTDLLATALGACIATVMAIVAQRRNVDLTGMKIGVEKEMQSSPARKIARLTVTISCVSVKDQKIQQVLEKAALSCPVHQSLDHEIDIPMRFLWD